MRRTIVFAGDVFGSLALIEWCQRGPWIRMLGFSMYHSRGDVWLPTPPAAMEFFRAMVLAGTSIFAVLFIATSMMIFRAIRRGQATTGVGFVQESFYGSNAKLIVKYSVLVLIALVSPFFVHWMWFFPYTHSERIAGGFAIMLAAFVVLLVVGDLVVGRRPSRNRIAVTA